MKILQIGNTDLTGSRFNGFDLHRVFRQQGIDSRYLVWEKQSDDPQTAELGSIPGRRWIDGVVRRIEKGLSLQSLLYPSGLFLPFTTAARNADLVHLHLLHTAHLSLLSLPVLARMKPTLWTVHDPWAFTGHCIYPLECRRWRTGCGECPMLEQPMAMKTDRTAFMWATKRRVYANTKLDLVVASKWMRDMAMESPLTRHWPVHHIPFGIDLETYSPGSTAQAKAQLGIPQNTLTIGFRASENPFKGLPSIIRALQMLNPSQPVALIAFEGKGLLKELQPKYPITELGWVTDAKESAQAYRATDIFLMPSVAEAFGLMAIEAMASGKPVVVFEGTSLPEVVFAPDCGVAVPQGDAGALAAVIARLLNNEDERIRRGLRAREIAESQYGFETYLARTLALYREVITRESRA